MLDLTGLQVGPTWDWEMCELDRRKRDRNWPKRDMARQIMQNADGRKVR